MAPPGCCIPVLLVVLSGSFFIRSTEAGGYRCLRPSVVMVVDMVGLRVKIGFEYVAGRGSVGCLRGPGIVQARAG